MTTDSRDTQLELQFTRGEQLSMRREVHLPHDEKWILWILDDHIGKGPYWPLTVQEIAAEAGFSVSKVYKVLASLKERMIVHWDCKPDTRGEQPRQLRSGERRFFIDWANLEGLPTIREAASQGARNSPMEKTDSPLENSEGCQNSPLEKNDSPLEKKTAPKFSNGESSTINALINAPSTPSGAATTEDVSKRILGKLKAAKVDLAIEACQKARANGLSLEAFEAILDHALQHPGRWPPGVIFTRLTSPDAVRWEPHEGWFAADPSWRPSGQAGRNLEAMIDAMSIDEIRAAIPHEHERIHELRTSRAHGRRPIQDDPDIRNALRHKLSERVGGQLAGV